MTNNRCYASTLVFAVIHVKIFAEKNMFLSVLIPLIYYIKTKKEKAQKRVRWNDQDIKVYFEECLPDNLFSNPAPIPHSQEKSSAPKISDPYIGKPETAEDRRRRAAWEEGRMDYMGVDCMDNIIAKLNATLQEPQYHPHTHLPNNDKVPYIAANAPPDYPPKEAGVEFW